MRATGDSVDASRQVIAGVTFGPMDPQDGQDAKAGIGDIRIRGSRLLLRALQPGEIQEEWRAMVTADPMAVAELPQEDGFKARLQRSGHLEDGWLDLAIDLDGVSIGRIQTFVPPGRPLPPGTFELGIGLKEKARNKGYGREALALLTDWLFEHAAAQAVGASTAPANVAMRTVFQRVGWMPAGSLTESGREWVMYRTTRREWEARRRQRKPPRP
jgi:RimJ/RimL family protein N-acetyltransferase